MITEHVNTETDSVPDITFEAFIRIAHNPTKTVHIRVTGTSHEYIMLCEKFNRLLDTYSYGTTRRMDL